VFNFSRKKQDPLRSEEYEKVMKQFVEVNAKLQILEARVDRANEDHARLRGQFFKQKQLDGKESEQPEDAKDSYKPFSPFS